MGRPSLVEQRKTEILDAFGRCVARFGIEGSSLEKIAEEAGMKRSILRHYIGNRDELVNALAEKVIAEYRDQTKALFASLPGRNLEKDLLDLLLPTQPIGSNEQLLVIEALIGVARDYPNVQTLVFEYVDDYVRCVADHLQSVAPSATRRKVWDTAYGLVCISFNQESLQPLSLPNKFLRAARSSAKSLIESLSR